MRKHSILALALLLTAACPPPTGPHTQGTSGGTSTAGELLAFVTQPSQAFVAVEIAPAVQVAVVDSFGVIDSTFTGSVTLSLVTTTVGAVLQRQLRYYDCRR